jgi:hypothetical protein
MSDIERRLKEDRAMRDAARRLLEADLGMVRGDVQERGIAQRAAEGVTTTSVNAADRAMDFAKAHPLAIGGGVLALLLILLRNPLLDLLIGLLQDDEEAASAAEQDMEPPAAHDRSKTT